ncbi:DUF6493 family protein [Microtetraspora niveoalba]|uniref:DUF6493 family protein n=1 Tax=Microtetraspora niveoalba TaxID=46175 RepID=UPI00082E2C1D|nr:DUF6493 family protein [Microtetraspora niveoalba]
MTLWAEIHELITASAPMPLVTRLAALDDAGRREIARELPGAIPVLRAGAEAGRRDWHGGTGRQRRWSHWGEMLRIAGAATIGGPAAVAAWLNRRDLTTGWPTTGFGRWATADLGPLVRALGHRPASWQADLCARLVGKLRTGAEPVAPLALELLRRTGTPPPGNDALVLAWVTERTGGDRLRALRADPLLDPLLPRLFEAEGVGRALRDDSFWLSALPLLTAEGRVRRETLLDGCVGRFLRGGSGADLRFFVRLHETLAPAAEESAPRARDHLRLLPSAPGPVAALALGQVRHLPLDPDDVAEALEGLLFRAETTLVRTGLSWLDESLRRHPGGRFAPALRLALTHESSAVRERAARIALKHAAALPEEEREGLSEVTAALPPDLGARFAGVFGGEAAPARERHVFVPPPLPPVTAAEPFPETPAAPYELIPLIRRADDWRTGERWLAGFVRMAREDRAALRMELGLRLGGGIPDLYRTEHWRSPVLWVVAMVRELITPGSEPGDEDRLPHPSHVFPPHLFLLRRLAEVYAALKADALPPVLLATPTSETGHLDPAELVARIEICEAAGVEPLAADLQQALLRLPRVIDPAVAGRAGLLTSEAGRAVARWAAGGGLPDPVTEVLWTESGANVRPVPQILAGPTGFPLIDELLRGPRQPGPVDRDAYVGWWPAMFPSHREVAALFLAPFLGSPSSSAVYPRHLGLIARAEGPVGDGTALLLGRFLLGKDPSEGAAALLTIAARGEPSGAALGRQAALLLVRTPCDPSRLISGLRHAALRGAHREVWEVLCHVLPMFLPAPGERALPPQTEAVALAADVAEWCGARGEIPAVAEAAARHRTSRLGKECRRLHTALTRPEVTSPAA